MQHHSINMTQKTAAKIAGLAYLVIIVAGIAAEFLVRSSIIVSGDAAATVANIVESETLFRSSIALDAIMIIADLIVAVALYALLRPVNRYLALGAALFRVIMDGILGANLLALVAAATLATDTTITSGLESDQAGALVMLFAEMQAVGYSIALVPFAFALLTVAYLLNRSNYVPRAIAGLVALAGVIYLTGSGIDILAPDLTDDYAYAYGLTLIAELSLAVWLVIKGPAASPRQHIEASAVPA